MIEPVDVEALQIRVGVNDGAYESAKASINEVFDPQWNRMNLVSAGWLRFAAADPHGVLLGGCEGYDYFGWLSVENIWLGIEHRGKGYGKALLGALESEALAKGCHGIHLDVYDFQHRSFFHSQGYVTCGWLNDFPTGQTKYTLCKRLVQRGTPPVPGVALVRNATPESLAPFRAQAQQAIESTIGRHPAETMNILLTGPQSIARGYLRGILQYGWLCIDRIFVSASTRGRGLGTKLLAQAEQDAVGHNCHHACVGTFEWQAPTFYEKNGYSTYLIFHTDSPGYRHFDLYKRLIATPADKHPEAA
jgi:GNAT superfamily N-acetyltransferase